MGKREFESSASLARENERAAKALDEVGANIAVLDQHGVILSTNRPWREFAAANRLADGSLPRSTDIGSNYLDICRLASGSVAECARAVHEGIRAVLDGRRNSFSLEYPCHAPDEQRWFMITLKPVRRSMPREVVVMHIDVTERHKAELAAQTKQAALISALAEVQAMVGRINYSVMKDIALNPADVLSQHSDKTQRDQSHERLSLLSKRETEVFMALVRGERNTEIAARLQLSNKSISTYRARIMDKLKVENNAQLVRLSAAAGLSGSV